MIHAPTVLARAYRALHSWWLRLASGLFHAMLIVAPFIAFGAWVEASSFSCPHPVSEARNESGQLSNMVNAYYLSTSPKHLPASLEQLTEGPAPLTEHLPDDPWGTPYQYFVSGERDFFVFSAGPDGVAWTDDDVWEEQ